MEYSIEPNSLISVLLPVRDCERFLSSCLDSLLSQNYGNIEIIAIDDFSRDASLIILKQYKKLDNRIKVYKNVKKYGLGISLNRAIRRAKGKFIVFMDPRDMVTKNKFQKQLDFLINNPKVVAVGTQCFYINDTHKRIGKSNFPLSHNHPTQPPLHGISVLFEGIMVNRYRIPKDLLYFPTFKHLFLYSDMAMKLMQYGELANIPEFLHFHRRHNFRIQSTTKHIFSLLKLWLNSRLEYDTKPTLHALFSTAFKSIL